MTTKASVHFNQNNQKWRSTIRFDAKTFHLGDFPMEEMANQMAREAETLSPADLPDLRLKYRELRRAAQATQATPSQSTELDAKSLNSLVAVAQRAEKEYLAAAQSAEHLHCAALDAWAAVKAEMKAIMSASRLSRENSAAVQVYSLIPRIGASDDFTQVDVQSDEWWRDQLPESEQGQ